MFDVGFSEMLMIGLVALLVFGPERLPRVARQAALWLRKVRAAVTQVKSEIDHELQLQDLRDSLARLEQEDPIRKKNEHRKILPPEEREDHEGT
jgi:sec-independent protein translocase protein TatB